MAGSVNCVIHQSRLEINGRNSLITLTTRHLTWEPVSSGGLPDVGSSAVRHRQSQTLDLRDVIGVKSKECGHPGFSESFKYKNSIIKSGSSYSVELHPLHPVSFIVYGLKRLPSHCLGYDTYTFTCRDPTGCQSWIDAIKNVLELPDFKRPKRLLVFVNPFGGKKKGPKIYREKIAPLFELADIHTDIIVTQRAGHANEVIMNCDLHKLDGLICVGGDGMFSELMNGLLTRTMMDAGQHVPQGRDHIPIVPDLRIGIIPAGSTDTVVYTTVGTNDPVTSALHIILGDSIGIDICSIYHKDEFLRYSNSLLYGYYGDVLQDSEKNRWMGPKRYDWSGFKKVMGNKSYDGDVSFLLSPNSDSHPRDGVVCYSGCSVCGHHSPDMVSHGANGEGRQKPISASKDGWYNIRGRFIGINSFTMSCRCNLCPRGPSPSSHLGDGCTDLMLVQSCSRTNYIRHLYRCATKSSDQFDFNFIKVYRVKEFSFKPLFDCDDGEEEAGAFSSRQYKLKSATAHNSVWNCDGEVINTPQLFVRVHCQLIKLFARGIEQMGCQSEACTKCCVSTSSDGDKNGFLEY